MLAFLQSQFGTCSPFLNAAFLGTWLVLQVSPRVWNINSSKFLVGLFLEFPISAIFCPDVSLFGGCAIYSCIFGFGLGFHVFYGNAASIPVVSWWIYCRFSHFCILLKDLQRLLGVAPSIPAFLGFGWVCKSFHGNIAPTPAVFLQLFPQAQHPLQYSFNVLVDLL